MLKWSLVVFLLFFSACECFVDYKGLVIDSATREPISGARLSYDGRNYQTDSLGQFVISYLTGICPKSALLIEADGYIPFELKEEYEDDAKVLKVKQRRLVNDRYYDNSVDFMVRNDSFFVFLDTLDWYQPDYKRK